MKKSSILAIIIGLIVVAAICYLAFQQPFKPVACPQDAKLCPDGTPVGRVGRKCEFAPCPNKPQQNITVTEPVADQEIGLPLVIAGQARVFENVMNYRLKDADGSVLVEGITGAAAPDIGQFGPYRVLISYPQPKGKIGTVEVFSHSAKDGSEINKTVVPVRFADVESQTVRVFFGNSVKDPNVPDCAKVFPVERRIAKTTAVARAALEQLLMGTSFNDLNQGYFTSINSGVVINSLTIDKGVAKVDFNDLLQAGVGGSCRVTAIRSQIEATLKQFSTVKTVVLSINGQSADILQP
ncbi:MAG: Gmad2 immunoglobulin-like domain-containing protein [Candidatus Komeilibacteria bacterium]